MYRISNHLNFYSSVNLTIMFSSLSSVCTGHKISRIKRTGFRTHRLSGKKVKKEVIVIYFSKKWKAYTSKKHKTQYNKNKNKTQELSI